MKNMKVTVIGGGQMGRALVGGMLASGVLSDKNAHIVELSAESRDWWKANHSDVATGDDVVAGVQKADAVIFAVKPNVLPNVAQRDDELWEGKLIISIAAGVSMEKLCKWAKHDRVIRVMPNTPSLVGEGASAFCAGDDVSPDDKTAIESMLGSVGLAVEVAESQMDAVTGLSGSGPAYVCLMIEALADGGVLTGLPRALAMKLATQTVLGTAKMIAETGRHPGELKDAVASPGGTTIAALNVLEQNGVRGALIDAVKASANRSRELGEK